MMITLAEAKLKRNLLNLSHPRRCDMDFFISKETDALGTCLLIAVCTSFKLPLSSSEESEAKSTFLGCTQVNALVSPNADTAMVLNSLNRARRKRFLAPALLSIRQVYHLWYTIASGEISNEVNILDSWGGTGYSI